MSQSIGIDEAGRGPVLGPMVIASVEWSGLLEKQVEENNLVLEDSKALSPEARSESADFLKKRANYRISAIPAWIFERTDVTIPQVEARVISRLLESLPRKKVYSDALGSGWRAHQWIKQYHPDRSFLFESKADTSYPSVSAASILAKVTRDQVLDYLKQDWGDLGSGYPSDPKTREWLRNWARKNSDWPPFVRTNWSTVEELSS